MSLRFETQMRHADPVTLRRNGTRLQLVSPVSPRYAGARGSVRRSHWSCGKSQTRLSAFRQTGTVAGRTTIDGNRMPRTAAWLALFLALVGTLISA